MDSNETKPLLTPSDPVRDDEVQATDCSQVTEELTLSELQEKENVAQDDTAMQTCETPANTLYSTPDEKTEIETLLERMQELIAPQQSVNNPRHSFKQLQEAWNKLENTPEKEEKEKLFQRYVDDYYNKQKLNQAFREYDQKKNLELKTQLCVAAEKLATDNDTIAAFHALQKLHQEFREIGPVPKEQKEAVWERFKAASSIINKRHQAHFESIKKREEENLDKKTVICEIAEAMDFDKFTTFAIWEEKTAEILALQTKWKTIGFAPQRMNVKIFERFRAACDAFFSKKSEFYKTMKNNMAANLEHKFALCEKAEALKDSTDWKETTEEMVRLQKEWKTIGPVVKKHSETVWKRFIAACDYFFAQKQKATSVQSEEEIQNLAEKERLLEALKQLKETPQEEDIEQSLRDIINEWNKIGFVPFKEKDRISALYKQLINALFERVHISKDEQRLLLFKNSLGKDTNTAKEYDKLQKTAKTLRNQILNYENNLGFLNLSPQKGNALIEDLQHRVERLKSELALTEMKLQVIEEQRENE